MRTQGLDLMSLSKGRIFLQVVFWDGKPVPYEYLLVDALGRGLAHSAFIFHCGMSRPLGTQILDWTLEYGE